MAEFDISYREREKGNRRRNNNHVLQTAPPEASSVPVKINT
jgi:hypothetical protein